jgi:hypothetical protein
MNLNSFQRTCAVASVLLILLGDVGPSVAWSNRGHRAINLIAAESFPAQMPAFIRSPAAIREISYLGPEPDRWRPEIAPELSSASSPDHVFRLELGEQLGTLPRRRYDFLHDLEQLHSLHKETADTLTSQRIGTLPWQSLEIFERLVAAFHSYRIVTGEFPAQPYVDMAPMNKEDRPEVEASVIFYAGWLGHYIGDVSMPLHDTVNLAGWVQKDNPHNYTTGNSIHHRLEAVADAALEAGKLNPKTIEQQVTPARHLDDPFVDILQFVKIENGHQEEVYKIDQHRGITGTGSPELDRFMESRMAEGGSMLRDLIYTAWIDSAGLSAPKRDARVAIP